MAYPGCPEKRLLNGCSVVVVVVVVVVKKLITEETAVHACLGRTATLI